MERVRYHYVPRHLGTRYTDISLLIVYSVLLCSIMTTQAEKTPLWLDCDPGTDSSGMETPSYI